MPTSSPQDFHYAVANTQIVIAPSGTLETFDVTLVDYVLVTESMDEVGRCNIRFGRMKLLKPQIITPSGMDGMHLEGFGEEAQKYLKWLSEHENDVRILRYGYTLRRESFSGETVKRSIDEVIEELKKDVEARRNPLMALVKGVDEPWDVCLVRLFWEVVQHSVRKNIYEMAQKHLFDSGNTPLSPDDRQEIEAAFAAASTDPTRIQSLGLLLQKLNVFKAYEDRFFALMRR